MWFNFIVVLILLVMAGTFAGLTLALFSLKPVNLKRKAKFGNTDAEKVYKLRVKGNLLLCSLLLGNVASYSIMAVFLGSITSGVIASAIATSLTFVFGEILPQAVFPRFAISIGARLYYFIWGTIIVFYPVAAPVAWILDKVLGEEPPTLWSKEELGEIISYHEKHGDGVIDSDEKRILLGALSFSELTARDVMIPKKEVFFLKGSRIVESSLLVEVKKQGFSRVPVLDEKDTSIEGILYSKDLIGIQPYSELKVSDLSESNHIIVIRGNMKLDAILNTLVKKQMHMALVEDEQQRFIGVVTMEDIVEEILKTELEDQKTRKIISNRNSLN